MKPLSRYGSTAGLALLLVLFAVPGFAASHAKKTPAPAQSAAPAATAATPAQAKPALGPIANYAAQGGVRQCLGRIDQITNFLSNGATIGAAVFLPPREPDRGLTSVSMEVQSNNGLSYVSSAYSPSANGCDGDYEAVTYWAGTCEQVAASFPDFKLSAPLRQHIVTLDGGLNAKIFLMPAGQGCISIKKEVVY
jgi:hypothetical protein